MKILVIVNFFLPKWSGGTEIATLNIANKLLLEGHEIHIVTSFDKGLEKESTYNDLIVHRVVHENIRVFGVLLFWTRIIKEIINIRPDIVWAQSISIGIPATISKILLNIPYVAWAQGDDINSAWFGKQIVSRLVIKNADVCISLTTKMKKNMQGIVKRSYFILPNGIEISKFNSNIKKRNFSNKKIVCVTRFYPVKGIQYLIEAMQILHSVEPDIKLDLIGEGPEKERMKNLSREYGLDQNINFVGFIPNEQIAEYLHSSNIFILPSLSEGLPVSILEAMACGLPIIATNVGGISELIDDNINGFLIDPKNPQQLSEKILKLCNNESLQKEMSNRNLEKIQNYDLEIISHKLESILKLTFHR